MVAPEVNVPQGVKGEKITLNALSEMTGFPLELIQQELFMGKTPVEGEVALEDLRAAMLNFIDATLLKDENE